MNRQEKIDYIIRTLNLLGFLETNKGLDERIQLLSDKKLDTLTESLYEQVKQLIDNLNKKKRKVQQIGEKIENIKNEIEMEKLETSLTEIK